MSGLLITIILVFFAVGITFGVIAVHALSAVRAKRRSSVNTGSSYESEYEGKYKAVRPGQPRAIPGQSGTGPGDQPRWPGNGDNDFRDW